MRFFHVNKNLEWNLEGVTKHTFSLNPIGYVKFFLWAVVLVILMLKKIPPQAPRHQKISWLSYSCGDSQLYVFSFIICNLFYNTIP